MNSSGRSSQQALTMLVDLVHQRTGLQFENSRVDMFADKITLLLKASNFSSLMDYYYYLKYDAKAEDEWLRLYSALAVNETYFWREYEAINAVAVEVVPRLLRERPGKPVRIWHAACASGEEPYTMGMALEEAGCFRPGQIEIDATDFNPAALALARAGIYPQRSFRKIPEEILKNYFVPHEKGQYKLVDSIRERVRFSYLNLLDESEMKQMRNYDIIICRNVFIYFSDEAIRRVAGWLYDSLDPSGLLFVAAAESLLRLTHLYELTEVKEAFAYQKRILSSML